MVFGQSKVYPQAFGEAPHRGALPDMQRYAIKLGMIGLGVPGLILANHQPWFTDLRGPNYIIWKDTFLPGIRTPFYSVTYQNKNYLPRVLYLHVDDNSRIWNNQSTIFIIVTPKIYHNIFIITYLNITSSITSLIYHLQSRA